MRFHLRAKSAENDVPIKGEGAQSTGGTEANVGDQYSGASLEARAPGSKLFPAQIFEVHIGSTATFLGGRVRHGFFTYIFS